MWNLGVYRNSLSMSARRVAERVRKHEVVAARSMAHIITGPESPPQVDLVKVSPHLTLRKLRQPVSMNEKRGKPETLVVMFPWLYATPKAVDKYCELYHRRGMSVVSVACDLQHFLLPSTAKAVAREVLEYLSNNDTPLSTEKFLVHTFSIGAYIYTVLLMELRRHQPAYDGVLLKVRGQVFDSITVGGLSRMSNGIAAQASNPLTRALIKGGAASYFFLTRPFTVTFYNESIEFFRSHLVSAPMLYYYCLNDPMADPAAMDDVIQLWRNRGVDVKVKCWERSVHACHLKEHPEQYLKALEGFVKSVGGGEDQVHRAKL